MWQCVCWKVSTNISEEQATSCFHLQGRTEAKYSGNTLYTYQQTLYLTAHFRGTSCFLLPSSGYNRGKTTLAIHYTHTNKHRILSQHHGILNCILEYEMQYERWYLHTNIIKYGILKLTRPASLFFAVWSSNSFFCCSSMFLSNINNSCCFCSCKIIN